MAALGARGKFAVRGGPDPVARKPLHLCTLTDRLGAIMFLETHTPLAWNCDV